MELIEKYFPGLPPSRHEQLARLEGLYHHWNARINVISRKDMDGLYEKHVLHSLSILRASPFAQHARVIDLGTGGGFPGIPLAILRPDCHFHLVDATGKKIKVVEAVADALGLSNVTTAHQRVEALRGPLYDYAVSRAVAPLKTLIGWARPLLKVTRPKASLVCLKGGDLAEEIAASGARPQLTEISVFFDEPWFRQKYVVEVALP